jgi:hypothetical protein
MSDEPMSEGEYQEGAGLADDAGNPHEDCDCDVTCGAICERCGKVGEHYYLEEPYCELCGAPCASFIERSGGR